MKTKLLSAVLFFLASFSLSACIAQRAEDAAQKAAVVAFDKVHPPALKKPVVAHPAAPVASGLDQVDSGLTEVQTDIGGTSTALDANDVPAAKVSNAAASVAVAGVHAKVKSLVPGAKANESTIEKEQQYPILRDICLTAFWFECAGVAIFGVLALAQSITIVAVVAKFIGLGVDVMLEIAGWLVLAAIGAMIAYYHIVATVHFIAIIGLIVGLVLAVRWALHNKAKVSALEADAEDAEKEAAPAIDWLDKELVSAGHYVEHLGLTVLQKLHILKTTAPIVPNAQAPAAPLPQALKVLG